MVTIFSRPRLLKPVQVSSDFGPFSLWCGVAQHERRPFARDAKLTFVVHLHEKSGQSSRRPTYSPAGWRAPLLLLIFLLLRSCRPPFALRLTVRHPDPCRHERSSSCILRRSGLLAPTLHSGCRYRTASMLSALSSVLHFQLSCVRQTLGSNASGEVYSDQHLKVSNISLIDSQ